MFRGRWGILPPEPGRPASAWGREKVVALHDVWAWGLAGLLALLAMLPLRIAARTVVGPTGVRVVGEIFPAWGFPVLRMKLTRRPALRPELSPGERGLGSAAALWRAHRSAAGPHEAPGAGKHARGSAGQGVPPGMLLPAAGAWLRVARAALVTRSLRFTARIGTGDAATTAILCGMAWSFAGGLVPTAGPLAASRSQVSVTPDYAHRIFGGEFDLEIATRVWRVVELTAFGGWLLVRTRLRGGHRISRSE